MNNRVLLAEEMKIIKRINIVSKDNFDKDIIIGFLLYKRNQTFNYKFKTFDEDKNYLSLLSPVSEDRYPSDEIDDLILTTVKNKYPMSFVINRLLFTTLDVDNLNRLIERPYEKCDIKISPDISKKSVLELMGRDIICFHKNIKIYMDLSSKFLKNIYLSGTCDFNRQAEIVKLLNEVLFF